MSRVAVRTWSRSGVSPVLNCGGCTLITSAPGNRVVRVAGRVITAGLPLPSDFPGSYPAAFFEAATGSRLPNHARFSSEFQSSMQRLLRPKAPEQLDEFMQTGLCNARQHAWVLLRLPPHTYFPVHAHPGLEMVHIVSGQMYEIRLQGCVPGFTPNVGELGPDISSGFEFVENSFGPGSWVLNEVGSIHQSFTKEEAVTLIAVWPSGYVFFTPEALPGEVFLPVNHDVASEVRWVDNRDYKDQ